MNRRIRQATAAAAITLFPVDQPRPREVILPLPDTRPFWIRHEGALTVAAVFIILALVAAAYGVLA